MPHSKPLSYTSLKAVLLHLEPNLRITLAVKVPCLRNTEKCVPLRINEFFLSHWLTEINGINYRVGVATYRKEGEELKLVRKHGYCSLPCDFDKYSFHLHEKDLTPGDISFGVGERLFVAMDNWTMARNLPSHQKNLETDASWDLVLPISDRNRLREQSRYRDENSEPPFKHFLLMTASKGKDLVRYELMEYNNSIADALKYLNQKLFGGRTDPIKVQNFLFVPFHCIRLPRNLQFDCENLTVSGERDKACLKNILPILTPSLKTITVEKLHADDYEVLKMAQKVIVSKAIQALPRTPFSRIHFKENYLITTDMSRLIIDRLQGGQEIGTIVSLDIYETSVKWMVNQCMAFPGALLQQGPSLNEENTYYRKPEIPYNIIIPIDEVSEISVRFVEGRSFRRAVLEIEVRARGKAESTDIRKTSKIVQMSANSQKAIIANMDPGFRLFLSQKNPNFRAIENEAPFKVEYLSITSSGVVINGATWNLGLKKYDRTPKKEKLERKEEFFLLDQIRRKRLLKNQNCKCNDAVHQKKWKIEQFQLRNENQDPTYAYFLHLSISNNDHNKTEILEYQGNFYVAMKYLMEKVLGGRKGLIHLKHLALEAHKSLLRIPEHLKLKAKNLTVVGNQNGLKTLDPILSSWKLDFLSIDRIENDDHEILRNVRKIELAANFELEGSLPYLPYPQVYVRCFSYAWMMSVVKEWQERVPEIGTKICFACDGKEGDSSLSKLIKEPGAVLGLFSKWRYDTSSTACIIFPLSDHLEINISYKEKGTPLEATDTPFRPHFLHHSVLKDCFNKKIKMIVRTKGFATPVQL